MIKVPFIENVNNDKVPENAVEIKLDNNNWSSKFPYSPFVKASLWHSNDILYINFEVDERHIQALYDRDNSKVFKDSCVEFFIAFDEEGYYNIETNCIGTMLMSHRKGRNECVKYAEAGVLNNIKRFPSLGRKPFNLKENPEKWSLNLSIPATSFFKHDIKNFHSLRAKCNFYKCGDQLPEPHYLSWQPILTPEPDFHRPEFFGEVLFE